MKLEDSFQNTMNQARAFGLTLTLLLLCSSAPTEKILAHPISLSTVVVNIEANRVKAELKILVEDLMLFQELQPNTEQVLSAEVLKTASQKHQQFLLDYFRVRNLDGEALPGQVTSMDTDEIPEEGVNLDAVMSTSIYYEIGYELASPPEYLTFSQNFGGDDNPLPSVMDLIVLQNNARLGYPVQISPKNPHSIELDWENPPTNDRKSWRQRRELMKQRREELLGITSYSTTYSYIYITDSEIRHEILVPLLTLETWFPIDRAESDFLEVEEQAKAAQSVAAYFSDHAPLQIDGIQVPAKVDRIDFYGLDFRDFAQRREPKRVGIHNARAGIILSYPSKQAPQKFELTWDTFNNHTPLLNSVVYDRNAPGYRHFFTPAEPTFSWQRNDPLEELEQAVSLAAPKLQPVKKLGLGGIAGFGLGCLFLISGWKRHQKGLIGGGVLALVVGLLLWNQEIGAVELPQDLPDEEIIATEDAEQILDTLQGNIYRAFDYRDESQIYDVLAESVSGELLESLFLKISNGLRMEEQGGAIARVAAVKIQEKQLLDRFYQERQPGMVFDCVWNVSGSVEHWGHIHTRENQYKGKFSISSVDQQWKITDLEVLNETKVAFQTGLREMK